MGKKEKYTPEGPPVDMSRLTLRVGKIQIVQPHPLAKDTVYFPLVELNEQFPRTIATRLAEYYTPEELEDKLVVVATHVKPVNVYSVTTQGYLLCACSPQRIEPLVPPPESVPGDRVVVKGFEPSEEKLPRVTVRQIAGIVNDLWVDENGQALYRGLPLEVTGKGVVKSETLSNCSINWPCK